MHKLLKLSNIAINVSQISKIHITKNKYTIHLNDHRVEIVNHSDWIYEFKPSNTIVEINKDNYPDYFKISEYIDKHSM